MRKSINYTIFNAKDDNGTGNAILVQDFKNIVLSLSSASSATFTILIQGSVSNSCPTFSSAATVANHWVNIATIDYISGSVVAGGTGYAAAGTDVFKNIQANISGLKWLCATISGYSAPGTVTLTANLYSEY